MQIDHFLEREEFKELDLLLTKEMHKLDLLLTKEMQKYAGEELINMMIDVFGTKEKARNWFYSKIVALGDERPYDFCKRGDNPTIRQELVVIKYGLIS
ncbi:MAG: DUF2384 domain-containing protein [Candidatus Pacearchaeota archaeon]|jgi:uncharacterized protein (DUF2384 family)